MYCGKYYWEGVGVAAANITLNSEGLINGFILDTSIPSTAMENESI